MNERPRFLNQHQPQTLVIGTLLCYFDAVIGLLAGTYTAYAFGWLPALATLVALGAGGFGIANEKRWGYVLAVAGAIVQLAALLIVFRGNILEFNALFPLVFDVALVALLLHPQSREYQKIWFR